MPQPLIDMTGKRIGRLTVISYSGPPGLWNVRCDCGTEKIIRGSSLRSGTKSCGCLDLETVILRNYKHGASIRQYVTPEYRVWAGMIRRCYRKTSKDYSYYGGRGISVCERWESFVAFLEDMGECPPGMSLDRYPNNDGNYEPENCRWSTPKQQLTIAEITACLNLAGSVARLPNGPIASVL